MMKTDEQIVNDAFTRAKRNLDICVTYENVEQKLLFLRAIKALDTLMGGDNELMKHWMHNHNNHLRFTPSQVISDEDNLYTITNYLEGFSER